MDDTEEVRCYTIGIKLNGVDGWDSISFADLVAEEFDQTGEVTFAWHLWEFCLN